MGGTKRFAATTLPHDGGIQRPAASPLKYHDCLPLVRDAQAGDLANSRRLTREQRTKRLHDVLPDFLRVMLDPARLWIVLPVIERFFIEQPPVRLEEQCLRGRGALV